MILILKYLLECKVYNLSDHRYLNLISTFSLIKIHERMPDFGNF